MPATISLKEVRHNSLTQIKARVKRREAQDPAFKALVHSAGGICAYSQRLLAEAEKTVRLGVHAQGIESLVKIGVKNDMAARLVQALRQQPTQQQTA